MLLWNNKSFELIRKMLLPGSMCKILRTQHNLNIWIGLLCCISNANAVSKRKPPRAQKWNSDKRMFLGRKRCLFINTWIQSSPARYSLSPISLIRYSLKSWTRTWNRQGWRKQHTFILWCRPNTRVISVYIYFIVLHEKYTDIYTPKCMLSSGSVQL